MLESFESVFSGTVKDLAVPRAASNASTVEAGSRVAVPAAGALPLAKLSKYSSAEVLCMGRVEDDKGDSVLPDMNCPPKLSSNGLSAGVVILSGPTIGKDLMTDNLTPEVSDHAQTRCQIVS